MEQLKKTILYDKHVNHGGTIVEFGGFLMPLYYTTIALEHQTVRNEVGMFDVSHMGEIRVFGKDTYRFVNYLLTSKIELSRKMQYALILNPDGTVVDDLMVYAIHEEMVMLVVNASNIDKDYAYIKDLAKSFDVTIMNESDGTGEIALQGPKSEEVLSKLFSEYPKHSMEWDTYLFKGFSYVISRSGYTGEDGFEIYGSQDAIITLWDKLFELGVQPCGLGARDTLRFESAMPLYGHEISDEINPLEAGLSFAVDFTKDDFIGKSALLLYKENPQRKVVGIELLERNVARAGYEVYNDDQKVGHVTTGYLSPTTGVPLALALVDIAYAKIGTNLTVQIRNKSVPCVVRNKKFYDKKNKV